MCFLKNSVSKDSPGGTMDKNLPANAGNMGLTPGSPERFYTLQSS